MRHDLAAAFVRVLADVVEQAPSPDQSSGVLVWIIVTAGGVLSTCIGAFVALRTRTTPAPVPLNSDGDDEEDALRARVKALETFLWRRRFDPNRIADGEEDPTHVRF